MIAVMLALFFSTVPSAQAGAGSDACYNFANAFNPPMHQLYPACQTVGENEPEGLEAVVFGMRDMVLGYVDVVRDCLEEYNPIGDPLEPLRCPL